MKPFKIFNLGGKRKIDKKTEDKIYETGTRILAEHDAIMRGEGNIFIDNEMSETEMHFFEALSAAMKEAKFDPALLKLRRNGGNVISVDYAPLCYMGKICLSPIKDADKHAVLRPGSKRALRIYENAKEAEDFHKVHPGTELQFRPGNVRGQAFMQYLVGESKVLYVENPCLQECIQAIPKWVAYLKYCKRTLR